MILYNNFIYNLLTVYEYVYDTTILNENTKRKNSRGDYFNKTGTCIAILFNVLLTH